MEQGGCLTPDTLVFTDEGLLRLDEIVQHSETGWREHTLTVMTDEGARVSRQVYNNGTADVLTVKTDMGLTITGTPNHKVKVTTADGPAWRQLADLQTGDAILVKLGQHRGKFQALKKPEHHHHNPDVVRLPSILDEELAFFLGYFMGDGFMTQEAGDWRLGVAVAHSSYLVEEMPRLMECLFAGIHVRSDQKDNDASLIYLISNRAIKEFLKLNGFDKPRSAEVSVPRLIRKSPPEVVGAFLRGLFEADGGLSDHYPTLSSTSKRLIDECATLLLGLGCPVKVEPFPYSADRYGTKPSWRLRIHSFRGLENWRAKIGCDSRSRFAVCLDFKPDLMRETSHVLPHSEYWVEPVLEATALQPRDHRARGIRVTATDAPLRQKLLRYARGDRNLTLSAYTSLSQSQLDFAKNAPPINDTWFVFVDSVEATGQAQTLDLEVDDNHTYLANGLVTHNSRRGALMLILNDWHPDIFDFINSKRKAGQITNANISVGVSDKLMEAVKADDDWTLRFPDTSEPGYDELWDGDLEKWMASGRKVITYRTIKARSLWNAIIESAWASAEPGVFFRERYNKMSNSWYFAPIISTNPCGEQGLPAFGVCNLGAINLAKFYDEAQHDVKWDELEQTARYATRFLDNVIDNTPYFFEENRQQQLSERRVGLNNMGLAELMIRLGIRYGSDESVKFIDRLYSFLARVVYETSVEIAQEKGAFPKFDARKVVQSGFMQSMPKDIRDKVKKYGIRNVTLLTQAPTGTTGTMVNTSTGIEPFFSWKYYRKSRLGLHEEQVPLVKEWFDRHPGETELPDYFVTAMDLTPEEHVKVQAAIQRWVDSSISKTANLPHDYTVEQTRALYELMYDLGCKGGTVYRDGSRDEQVLMLKTDDAADKKASPNGKAQADNGKPVEQVATPHRVYPRPRQLAGVTVSRKTPFGTAFITMNSDEHGNPFEVFITVGKAGSDLQADAEGLGRMISLQLRTTAPQNRKEMLKLVVDQLQGIGGSRAVGLGPSRVLSLPDAVAGALLEHYFPPNPEQQLKLPIINGGATEHTPPAVQPDVSGNGIPTHGIISGADICPECGLATLVRVEGCEKCLSCEYSRC
ncbi:MAG: adenosylcobalamin-dependent ribonucleoside-diphosphate reductase [Chloroflexi bacterium]|nr:adenosylcobalamin-dependent ribonucleoside-diphosphate reductase [Chloroflexota bacterium]